MKGIYERYNRELAPVLPKGWKFSVPQGYPGFQQRDDLLVEQKAPGLNLDKISPELRKQLGPAITEAALKSLFQDGNFNADAHSGNFIIDEKTKTIHLIDLGQSEDFSRSHSWANDDRYTLAQFIRAVDAKDVKSTAKYVLQMQENASASAVKPDALQKAIGEVFKTSFTSPSDEVIALTNAFADQGVLMKRRFAFGALKGLIVLQGEHYVSDDQFRDIMKRQITGVITGKLPYFVKDELPGFSASVIDCMKGWLTGKIQR
jgi:predicted unusual protein kinase regulating ubiquinone biosynthesis (AarF/ABC1/UbiB family)